MQEDRIWRWHDGYSYWLIFFVHARCLTHLGMSYIVLTLSGSSVCVLNFRMHFLSRSSFHTHSVSFIYMWCGGPLHPSTNPSLPDSSINGLQCRTMAALSKMLKFLFYFNKVENGGYFPSCNSLDWIHRSFYADLEHLYFSYMTRC